ncbi:Spo0B domain-containing protein [Paenibacillus chartarius]|uniref:Spo0B domain-containing protein n=1 Tax=Paenibacillus chartarius TaxID=747481 RepID=A0ABV6DIV5_9BACL
MIDIPWFIAGLAATALAGYALGKRTSKDVRDQQSNAEPAAAAVKPVESDTADALVDPEVEALLREQRETLHQEMVHTISHIRHDWMNDMQILSGYIQLKKYDYLAPYMEKIRLKLHNESVLGKLGDPSLVAYLLTFRTECKDFELELEFPQEIHIGELPLEDGAVERTVKHVLESFRRYAREYVHEPNAMTIEMAKEDEGLLIDFEYNGQYDADKLKRELDEQTLLAVVEDIYIEACELEEGLVSLAVRLPYRESDKTR